MAPQVYDSWDQLLGALRREKSPEKWAQEAANQPSYQHLTDEWEPTNPSLWDRVLEVAQGHKREVTLGDRTIHAPNRGGGFKHWPNPRAIAWAVKQYNGFGGKWKRQNEAAMKTGEEKLHGQIIPNPVPMGDYQYRSVRDLVPGRKPEPEAPPRKERVENLSESAKPVKKKQEIDEAWQEDAPSQTPKKQQAEADKAVAQQKLGLTDFQWASLGRLRLGSVQVTAQQEPAHVEMARLQELGLVKLSGSSPTHSYWDITRKGSMIVVASLADELDRKITDLLHGDYDLPKAKALGKWFGDNFRVQSPKTPKGQKQLKDKAEALRWYLANGGESYRESVRQTWENDIRPKLHDLIQYFTDEGGVVVPRELTVGGITYENDVGVPEATLKKYIARLETIFGQLRGWHAKALKGGLTVVLASPRNFHGTAGGKYKSSGGKLLVRATPNVLKREGNSYGSFEYIIVHELGHRYEHKNRQPEDFDKPHWWTTKYSRKEGESFAELFALSHFRLHGAWDETVVERFQKLMSGQPDTAKPELPEHLRAVAGV